MYSNFGVDGNRYSITQELWCRGKTNQLIPPTVVDYECWTQDLKEDCVCKKFLQCCIHATYNSPYICVCVCFAIKPSNRRMPFIGLKAKIPTISIDFLQFLQQEYWQRRKLYGHMTIPYTCNNATLSLSQYQNSVVTTFLFDRKV